MLSGTKSKDVPDDVSARLGKIGTREEARSYLDGLKLTGDQLKQMAKTLGVSLAGVSKKDQFRDRIVEHTVGFRLNSKSIRGGNW